jgi:hypothetical protein
MSVSVSVKQRDKTYTECYSTTQLGHFPHTNLYWSPTGLFQPVTLLECKPGLKPNQAQARPSPQLRFRLEFQQAWALWSPAQGLSPSQAQHITTYTLYPHSHAHSSLFPTWSQITQNLVIWNVDNFNQFGSHEGPYQNWNVVNDMGHKGVYVKYGEKNANFWWLIIIICHLGFLWPLVTKHMQCHSIWRYLLKCQIHQTRVIPNRSKSYRSSVATAIADVFRNNRISVGRNLAKILKIFEKIDDAKSRAVI